jgi:drug/metabolite transporter (DMT)-like permease
MVEPQTANLIQKTLFIWVSILAIIFLGERFNLIYFVSYLLIVLGNFYISPSLAVSFGKGEIMILVATLLWSLENIMAKRVLKSVSSELVGLFRMGIGSLILLSLALVSGKGRVFLNYNFQQLSTVFVGGIILFFYVYFWYKALKYAPASLVTLVLSFSLVVGNVLNGFFAGVKILLRDVYSTILICSAVLMIFFTQNVIPHLMRNLFNRFPLSRE